MGQYSGGRELGHSAGPANGSILRSRGGSFVAMPKHQLLINWPTSGDQKQLAFRLCQVADLPLVWASSKQKWTIYVGSSGKNFWLAFGQMLASNVGREPNHPEVCLGLSQSLHTRSRPVPQIRPRSLPSTSLPIHYLVSSNHSTLLSLSYRCCH